MCWFKQKTAYEMRISDWSSDVCSSDLETAADPGAVDADHVDDAAGFGPLRRLVDQLLEDPRMAAAPGVAQVDGGDGVVHARIIAQWVGGSATEIGRASCRERVCPYV